MFRLRGRGEKRTMQHPGAPGAKDELGYETTPTLTAIAGWADVLQTRALDLWDSPRLVGVLAGVLIGMTLGAATVTMVPSRAASAVLLVIAAVAVIGALVRATRRSTTDLNE